MKNFNKKVVAIVVVLFMSVALMNITYAFPKMDICNYTNGDHSGDYYDGFCTKSGALAEKEDKYNFPLKKSVTNNKKNTISKLKHVDAYNGSSTNFARNSNPKRDAEITKLKEIISKQNLLIKKYKEENEALNKKEKILINDNINKNLTIKKYKIENNRLRQYIKYISEKIENKTINYSNNNSKNTIQKIDISTLNKEDRKEYIRQLIIEKNKHR